MAAKNVLISYPLINNHSLAASFDTFSNPTNITFLDNGGLVLNWSNTGSPIGILEFYVSNDGPNQFTTTPPRVPQNWSKLYFTDNTGATVSSVAINGSATDANVNLHQLPFIWIAIKYTRTSGTGSLLGMLAVKEIG